jgi:hypothetical protein
MALVAPKVVTYTKASGTTAYAANDAVSPASGDITATNLGPGRLVGLIVTSSKASVTPRLRVHFYRNTAPTMIADNAACTAPLEADVKSGQYAGAITMPAMVSGGSGADASYSFDFDLNFPLDTDTYHHIVQTLDAWTPDSSGTITLTYMVDRGK